MIKQAAIGLNSRSEANPYNEYGFLPLITAPMYSVVDDTNYQMFLDNNIQVCLPRQSGTLLSYNDKFFIAISLNEFIENFVLENYRRNLTRIKEDYGFSHIKVCIDTANGNIPNLHEAIRKAKEIHGDNLVIMTGNVASVEAFVELAKTGVDYIRVGIGGGGGCNTTSNTGIGQENLKRLIFQCKDVQDNDVLHKLEYSSIDRINIAKVKMVADGISSWVRFCEKEYGYNDNGYAAINELLFAGADLVMVGKLFAQCLESAGEKTYNCGVGGSTWEYTYKTLDIDPNDYSTKRRLVLDVKYSGMSTYQEQRNYRPKKKLGNSNISGTDFKPSEGSVQWIPVRWTLNEWLNGSANQDEAPYLMGWINSIKSAMAYTGKTTL